MDPYSFTTEEEGITIAERTLDELRVILDATGGGRITPSPSNGLPLATVQSGDQDFALHEQLDNLEEMLRMVTDARFTRTLIEDENERAIVENAEEENIDLLRVIVMITRDVVTSQTYAYSLPEDQPAGAGPFREPIVVNRTQTHIADLRHHREGHDRELPPSPLSWFSDELEPEPEQEPVPQITSCIVCAGELSSIGRLETPCGHHYCPACVISLVESYTSQLFPSGPLRCCPEPHPSIPSRYVYRFINNNKRIILEEKILEAETPFERRIYCPQDTCRKFIDSVRVTPSAGSITCPRCRNDVCLGCRQAAHRGVGCEKNADDIQALSIQRKFGWGRCPGCGFVVEKVDGCNSVVCSRCRQGFTYQPAARIN